MIELLVVIAIIAILASLLLPVLSRTKASAKRIQCASNMKQKLVFLHLYLTDNEEILPGYWEPIGKERILEVDELEHCLENRIWIGRVWCTAEGAKQQPSAALFVSNDGKRDPIRIKANQVKIPTEALIYTETRMNWFGHSTLRSPRDESDERYWEDEDEFLENIYAAIKVHNDGNNTALLDGHVEWVHHDELWKRERRQGKLTVTHPFWYME